ncbi:MAG: nucleotidyl transferase AbiEii/AbiGii toxin family protein, partial [Prevotella sp.]|nr:nucleotidyl transferase AbiEii/AbiGii toxin family protein [Prevotella sp.]
DNTYPEPRKLFVKYKSACLESLTYLSSVVTLEVGSRSLLEPNEHKEITSMVEKLFPTIRTSLVSSKVATAVPGKTFLEKVFLLHEMFSIEGRGLKAERKSRHLYDLCCMMDYDSILTAIDDNELWESIRHHREIYTSVRGMDYTPDVRKRIVLVPRPDIINAWEDDYKAMSSTMIYGDKPTFQELVKKMVELENKFHNH